MYACVCRAVTENEVRRAGHAGVTSASDLITLFNLNDAACCGRCARKPERLVALAAEGAAGERELVGAMPSTARLVSGAARALVRAAVGSGPATGTLRRGTV